MANPKHADGLEARLYHDLGQFESLRSSNLPERLHCTPDELRPIVLRGITDGRIFGFKGANGGPQYLALTSKRQDALTTEAATTRGGRPKNTRGGRPQKAPRLAPLGPYAPVPRAILKDPNLSMGAKAMAATIADLINLAPWNVDLHVDASFPELTARTGASRTTLQRFVNELKAAGYLTTENLNRGGVRYQFTSPPVGSM